MKIRRGFVTNSSSTNFGTMLLTSLSGIGLSSLLSLLDGDTEGDGEENKKLIVRLVISAPEEKILKPGSTYRICAKVMVLIESEGEFKADNQATSQISFNCTSENGICEFLEPFDEPDAGETISKVQGIFVIDDEAILNSLTKGGEVNVNISGSYQGSSMSRSLKFSVPVFTIRPNNGMFLAEMETEQEFDISVNTSNAMFDFDFESSNMLKVERTDNSSANRSEHIKLTECMDDEKEFFRPSVCKITKEFEVTASTDYGEFKKKYTAKFLREGILIPPPSYFKKPFVVTCYSDEEKDEREKNAFLLPIKVMKYNEEKKDLEPDIDLANSLEFEFTPDPNNKVLTEDEAKKAIDDANIICELDPNDGTATDSKPYATYRIYANAIAESSEEKVDMVLTISCDDENIKDVTQKGVLKPLANYRDMIKWLIEYPIGTTFDKYIKLGTVATYWGALDFISNRVYRMSECPRAKAVENHYEDGKLDLARASSVVLRDAVMPTRIGEFEKIQSLYHELCHTIEDMNGDIPYLMSGLPGERHSYFIQYLSDVAKELADLEKNCPMNIDNAVRHIIGSYDQVYFNSNNIQPLSYYSDFSSWFGVETPTQHFIFDRCANFNIYCDASSISDEQKKNIADAFAKYYFPGDILGHFEETDGPFKGAKWVFTWGAGELLKLSVTLDKYTFTEVSRKWMGSNKLALHVVFEVKNQDGKTDTLRVELDGGEFDINNHEYPKVDKFKIAWKAVNRLSDSIIAKYLNEEHELVRS